MREVDVYIKYKDILKISRRKKNERSTAQGRHDCQDNETKK